MADEKLDKVEIVTQNRQKYIERKIAKLKTDLIMKDVKTSWFQLVFFSIQLKIKIVFISRKVYNIFLPMSYYIKIQLL